MKIGIVNRAMHDLQAYSTTATRDADIMVYLDNDYIIRPFVTQNHKKAQRIEVGNLMERDCGAEVFGNA